jgi:hypothetical protein
MKNVVKDHTFVSGRIKCFTYIADYTHTVIALDNTISSEMSYS